jgi:Protein of unknown function (DUF3500)
MRELGFLLAGVVLLLSQDAYAQKTATTASTVEAAKRFLSTLDADQRKQVLYTFTDDEQRARWSNFPTGVVPRGGISFKQMTEPQRDAALKLLGVVLSPMGPEKVNEIRQADDDFKANGSKRGPGGPPPGAQNGPPPVGRNGPVGPSGRGPNGPGFGSDLYYISFLGAPSTTAPWMLQFGGHHLTLNITIA